jgi:hypothetical protein
MVRGIYLVLCTSIFFSTVIDSLGKKYELKDQVKCTDVQNDCPLLILSD